MGIYTRILWLYICPVLAVIIIILNSFEIYSIIRLKIKRNNYIVFVLNLAITDLCVGITILLDLISHQFKEDNLFENLSIFSSIIQYAVLRILMVSSILNLLLLTLIRWISVKHPVKSKSMLKKYSHSCCALVWLVSVIISVGYFCALYWMVTQELFLKCEMLLLAIIIYPSCILFAILYYLILKDIKRRNERLCLTNVSNKMSENDIPENKGDSLQLIDVVSPENSERLCLTNVSKKMPENDIPENKDDSLQLIDVVSSKHSNMNVTKDIVSKSERSSYRIICRKKNTIMKTRQMREFESRIQILVVRSVIAFVLSWLPMATFTLIKSLGLVDQWKYSFHVHYTVFTLAFANSIMDAIFYFFNVKGYGLNMRLKKRACKETCV